MNFHELFKSNVKGLKEGSNGELVGLCPFHDDNKRSWSGNIETGLWICHAGCGKGNAYQFAKKVGIDPRPYITTTKISNKNHLQFQKSKNKPIAKIDLTDEALEYVEYLERHWDQLLVPKSWSKKSVFDTGTGWDKKAKNFTFSHMDAEGNVINIHWHNGWSHTKGDGSCKWFPLQMMIHYDRGKPLIICEGEKDCLSLLSRDAQALTATTGANSIPKDLSPLKHFKDIVVLYDNDKAGREGSRKMAQKIKSTFESTKVRVALWLR